MKRLLYALILVSIGFVFGHDLALTRLAYDMKVGRLIERSNGLIMQIRARRFLPLSAH